MGKRTETPEEGMTFHIVTLFPELFDSFLSTALFGKAVASGKLRVNLIDPRQFTTDKHRTVDDTPFGGGEGMVLKPEPMVAALEAAGPWTPGGAGPVLRILLSPQGEPLGQADLRELASRQDVALLCGRYEGVDDRVRHFVDREISLGDFVLNGGEVAAMAVVEGVARLLPDVIGNQASLTEESFSAGLLEYPHFTRPREFRGHAVPEVLISGDHARVAAWRRDAMLRRTAERRPDLWRQGAARALAARTTIALLHYPVYDRARQVVTTAITNLDLHDIARSTCTYGLAGYYVVTPLQPQRELAARILDHWRSGFGATYNALRAAALALLRVAPSLAEVVRQVTEQAEKPPVVVATTANRRPGQTRFADLAAHLPEDTPLLLLLGTGWGLSDAVLGQADLTLAPVEGGTAYNHLAVRSAAAIILDRLFGLRDEPGHPAEE